MEKVECVFCKNEEAIEDAYECEGRCYNYICEDCRELDGKFIPFNGDCENTYVFCGDSDCGDYIQDYENDKYV